MSKDGWFEYVQDSGEGMYRLCSFLLDDIGCSDRSNMKKWVNQSVDGEYGTNAHFLEKQNDNIIIKFEYAEDSEQSECLNLSKKSLIHILNEWEKVCKEQPKEVIITRNGDEFTFEKKF